MIIILFRLLIIFAIIFFIYAAYKYIVNPKRKLEIAQENQSFYFYDEENVKKNFLLTYKGALFEGEKYLGTTEDAFEVVTITVSTRSPDRLVGISREDLYFIEKEILIRYPHAKVEWRHPIKKIFD
ncbi:sigma-w pathway protein ysdB [Virgibacillus sp. MSP4-1]|uniref:hypothetical protein n=1 Tax=Virgibacillus sp. MSP4-1 TaxID=2700081 RepID=UPI0003A4FD99|nr:hypothetical protein [Virgibacillus sp. MSP4-1]QHS22968.1 sigma-w pathway protein ysdB [Virgibacillus sp. MSP4-1]